MQGPVFLDDLDDPRLAIFRRSDGSGPPDPERFVAESEIAVARLLESDLEVEAIVATPDRYPRLAARIPAGVTTYLASHRLLTALCRFDRHRGVTACARRPPAVDPVERLRGRDRATVVVLDGVVDPINVGAILRAARAFAADLVLLGPTCGDPWSRRAIRAAMGNGFALPIAREDDLAAALRRLRGEALPGLEIVAATVGPAAIPARDLVRGDHLALVLGNEGTGVSREVLEIADREVTIPMAAAVDSLNVAAAAAVLLYELGGLARARPG